MVAALVVAAVAAMAAAPVAAAAAAAAPAVLTLPCRHADRFAVDSLGLMAAGTQQSAQ